MGPRGCLIIILLAGSAIWTAARPLPAQPVYDGGPIRGPLRRPGRAGGGGLAAGQVQASPPLRPVAAPEALSAIERLRAWGGEEFEARFGPGDARPRSVHGFRWDPESGPAPGALPLLDDAGVESRARAFLAFEPELFACGPEELALEAVHRGAALTVARFEQLHRGLPVLDGGMVVQVDLNGSIVSVLSSLVRGLDPPRAALMGEAEALLLARAKLGDGGAGGGQAKSRLKVGRVAGRDRLLWEIRLRANGRPYGVVVDAVEGEVLGVGSLLRTAGCTGVPAPRGKAYSPSPAKGEATVRELPDLDCRSRTLSGLFVRAFNWTGEDFWLNPVFELRIMGRMPNGPEGGVIFDFDLPAIAQVNVFLHATLFHRYVRGLGFTKLDRPFPAVANALSCFGYSPCDNAYYDPLYSYATGDGLILFGKTPDVNVAFDGDAVYHEYTHGVVEETSRLGNNLLDPDYHFSAALNEAFADYFSSTFAGDPAEGEYFSAAVGMGDQGVRNMDNDRRWPDDVDLSDPHETGLIWAGAAWSIRQAFSGGGTDPAGIERADRLLYSCLTSLPSNADLLRAANVLIATAAASGLSQVEMTSLKDVLAARGLAALGPEPPLVLEELPAGESASGEVAAVVVGNVRLASVQYRVAVPADGAQLLLTLSGEGAGNLDLYARFNAPVTLRRGSVLSSYRSEGAGSDEIMSIDGSSVPPISPGTYFVAVANRNPAVSAYRLTTSLQTGTVDRVQPLAIGGSIAGALPGNSMGAVQYTVAVPATAGRRLELSASADGEIELHIRHGSPVEGGTEGQVRADVTVRGHSPATYLGEHTVPPLRSGIYYLALKNRSADAVSFTVRANLPAAAPEPPREAPLASGSKVSGSVRAAPAGVGLLDPTQQVVTVPADGARLTMALETRGDLRLYLRREARVDAAGGEIVFDHAGSAPGPGNEEVMVDFFTSPRLEAGRYFAAVVNHGAEAATYDLRADVSTAASDGSIRPLQSAVWAAGRAEGSGAPGGKLSDLQHRLTLAPGAGGLDVVLNPEAPGDLDLFLRRDRPVQMIEGNVAADRQSVTARGAEAITILARDLQPGDYFIAVLNNSPAAVPYQVIAVAEPDPISVLAGDADVLAGALSRAPSPPTGCSLTLGQVVVEVPQGAARLEVSVSAPDGGPLEVLMRREHRVLIDLGTAVFDRVALSSDGPMVEEGAALLPGLYFFALSNCQPTPQRFEVLVRVDVPGAPEIFLADGSPSRGRIAAAAPGQVSLHPSQYLIDVPPGAVELALAAWGEQCSEADLDLFVSLDQRVTVDEAGKVIARWQSQRARAGGESLVLTMGSIPPLVPGRYFVAVRNREPSSLRFSVGAQTRTAPSVSLSPDVPERGQAQTSGQAGVGSLHPVQYRIEVFPGADWLSVDLSGNGDVDLLLRYGLPVAIDPAGHLVADHDSSTPSPAGVERIVLPPENRPGECLRPGTYFAAVGNFEMRPVDFALTGAVGGSPAIPARIGDVVRGEQLAAEPGGLRPPELQVAVAVPPGSPGFQADLLGTVEGAEGNLDLFLRQGRPVEFGGGVVATFSSQNDGSVESLTVPASKVIPGRYYLAVASRAMREVPFTLRLLPLSGTVRDLAAEMVDGGVAPPSSAAGIGWLAPEQFRLRVPPFTAPFLWVTLASEDPASPLELHLKYGGRVEVEGKTVISDRSDTRPRAVKSLMIRSPAGGDYFLAVRNLRPRNEPFRIDAGTGPRAVRGDVDENGVVELTDPISILRYLFLAGPLVCTWAADLDDSGTLDLTDAISILNFLFLSGPPPGPPFPQCGPVRSDPSSCSSAGCS